MRTENEIRERINELNECKKFLFSDFAPDHVVNEVQSMIDTILWVLKEQF